MSPEPQVCEDFRRYARKTDRKASELIREAMELIPVPFAADLNCRGLTLEGGATTFPPMDASSDSQMCKLPPISLDEEERQKALDDLRLVDTQQEERFDRIV